MAAAWHVQHTYTRITFRTKWWQKCTLEDYPGGLRSRDRNALPPTGTTATVHTQSRGAETGQHHTVHQCRQGHICVCQRITRGTNVLQAVHACATVAKGWRTSARRRREVGEAPGGGLDDRPVAAQHQSVIPLARRRRRTRGGSQLRVTAVDDLMAHVPRQDRAGVSGH